MKLRKNLNHNHLSQAKPRFGFSLIELSVVILVIGILVIGVTKGASIINAAKLESARSLTRNSPIVSMEGLMLWLDPVSEKSFDASESYDGGKITNWYDINQQYNSGLVATQATANRKPTYTAKAINGLPAVRFVAANNPYLQGTLPTYTGTQLEIFIVRERVGHATNSSYMGLYKNGSQDNNNTESMLVWELDSTTIRTIRGNVTLATFTHPGDNVPYIFSVRFDGSNTISYLNGVASTPAASSATWGFDRIVIGNRFNFTLPVNGYIAETIVFRRVLTSNERTEVTKYLGNKWGIKIQ
ncbi:MAG: hypothetical protein K0R25_603 [Rickettsiaceae bacterium]|nr:hypothetical protein [Rickettsiaceae bacterium]